MDLLWPYGLLLLPVLPFLVGIYVWMLRRRKPIGARYSSLLNIRRLSLKKKGVCGTAKPS